MIRFRRSFIRLEDRITPAIHEFIDPHPASGNQFGTHVVPLATGNVVVTAPGDAANGTGTGAVYLFNGKTGALISTLQGSTAFDAIGSGGVIALANGNFVVRSPNWDSGSLQNVGAVTWGSGVTGVSGVVSAGNSLVGAQAFDQVGNDTVTPLTNGNYVVRSPAWDNGSFLDAGAVTFGNGATGTSGVVSPLNSLVGTAQQDFQQGSVVALTNGNYVVRNPLWTESGAGGNGAVTFGNGLTGVSGPVTVSNSLIGAIGDQVGNGGVLALANGDYVVNSKSWDNDSGLVAQLGAVTHVNGKTGLTGLVSPSNSVIGPLSFDGNSSFLTALTNGNYVLCEPFADRMVGINLVGEVGAVTLFDGATGGVIGRTLGNNLSDQVGFNGIIPLTNGNYVILSPMFDAGAAVNAGAATLASGTAAPPSVTIANSLVGATGNDSVGSGGGTALTNGNFVVRSPLWDNGAATNAGAVTWGNGTLGVVGTVSALNSLVGSKTNDLVGNHPVVALTNGHYVARTNTWDNGALTDVGAVTWGDGTVGVFGAVSATNSLIGSKSSDSIGADGVVALLNGNYVVGSQFWDNGATVNAGAVTYANGTTGLTGTISAANSLVGIAGNDSVGSGGVTVFPNGNYAIASPAWDNGALTNAGAMTFSPAAGVVGGLAGSNSAAGQAGSTGLLSAVVDTVNGQFYARFPAENGGRVRIGSLTTGFAAPRVANVIVNDGAIQRSNVTKLTVEFDQRVQTLVAPASLAQLVSQKTGDTITLSGSVATTDVTRITFTFAGPATSFGSLLDGRYTLTIPATGIRNGTQSLDGNGDGTGGDNYVLVGSPANGLFRLFGDADGSGQVGSSDFLAFRLAFLSSDSTFDSDGDGQVGSSDFLAFRLNFLATV
ncbi:MAG: hypothetical protein K1X57_14290 [Gemmataceae bacterium]|nr:hypothetical protein [Gemmataceae bacterium]